jgi:carnitine O-acetyltransferase
MILCTVVPDGYGLSYAIGNDHVRWTTTCLKSNTKNRMGQTWRTAKELKAALEEAAEETKKMLEDGDVSGGDKAKL